MLAGPCLCPYVSLCALMCPYMCAEPPPRATSVLIRVLTCALQFFYNVSFYLRLHVCLYVCRAATAAGERKRQGRATWLWQGTHSQKYSQQCFPIVDVPGR